MAGVLYTTVLADPPWPYRDNLRQSTVKRGARDQYKTTMSVEAICNLYTPSKIEKRLLQIDGIPATLAGYSLADNAHLYLWTTNAFMVQAHQVAEAWGFRPTTILTWCKPRIGMGHYYRNTTEHVIFAVRGKLPVLRRDQKTHFEAPVGRHSEKPQRLYEIIEQTSPGPYLEIFARRHRPGWTSFGDELVTSPPPVAAAPAPLIAYSMLTADYATGEVTEDHEVYPDPGLAGQWPD